MILLKNKNKKANIKIGNNIEIKDGSDFPFDLTLYGKSTQATSTNPVSPSPDYPSPIESITEISATVTGKNLFDKDNCISGSYLSNLGKLLGSSTFNITEYIPVIPNAEYTISGITSSGSNPSYCFYDKGKNFISGETHKGYLGEKTITIPANCYYFRDSINNVDIDTYQFEKGTQATTFEPFKENITNIDLQGNELCSLPNGTKDEVNITNGEALLTKRIGKVVLDGSESWRKAQIGTTGKYYFTFTPSDLGQVTSNPSVLSNYFVQSTTWSEQSVGIWFDTNLIIKTEGSLNNTETVNEFKTWLSTHNVEVLYELAEPETINLGTVEMPHTYEGVSNITNSADTEMVVKYYKKFEFDKILRSGYNIDEQEYEIAKKQMANGKRKKILSSYVDCIIKIDLGLLDNKTYQEYKGQLEDGEYEYWSYKYNQYKKANFILTKPSITTEYAYDDEIGIDDMEITLEKSSDVS